MPRTQLAGWLSALFFTLPSAAAHALDLYRPSGEQFRGWACTAETLGVDGGALGLSQDTLIGVDTQCNLTNPVPVRDMDAILYDADCQGEGETMTRRTLIMPSLSGVYIMRNGFVFEWERCDAS